MDVESNFKAEELKTNCYSKLVDNFREKFQYNLYKINYKQDCLFIESRSDIIEMSKFTRKLSLDSLCRKFIQYPTLIKNKPDIKFLLKRFQIYDLIVRNLPTQAKNLYISSFINLFNNKRFIPIFKHFNLLFSLNEISQKILIENYISMRNALIDEKDNLYISIIESEQKVVIPREEGFYLGSCLENEITNFDLLPCECLIFSLVIEEIKKIKHDFCYLSLFNKEIQRMQEEFYNENNFFDNMKNGDSFSANNNSSEYRNDLTSNINAFISEINNIKSFKEEINKNSIRIGTNYFCDSNLNYNNTKIKQLTHSSVSEYIPQESINFYIASLKKIYYNTSFEELIGTNDTPTTNESVYKMFIIGKKVKASFLYSNKTKLSLEYKLSQNYISFPVNTSQYSKLNHIFQNKIDNYYNCNIMSSNNKKKSKFRETNSFLKTFSPKFMKRESLDEIILRRFKKFVVVFLKDKEITFGQYLQKNCSGCISNSINSNISNCSVTNANEINSTDYYSNIYINASNSDPLSFIIEFVVNNYLPPCKIENNYSKNNKNLVFKSFSSQYLLWLFSDPIVRIIYDEFVKEFSQQIIDMLITNYDLNNKENCIISKLSYYIHNLNIIYHDESNIDQSNKHKYINNDFSFYIDIRNINSKNTNDINNINHNVFSIKQDYVDRNIKIKDNKYISNIKTNLSGLHISEKNQTKSIRSNKDNKEIRHKIRILEDDVIMNRISHNEGDNKSITTLDEMASILYNVENNNTSLDIISIFDIKNYKNEGEISIFSHNKDNKKINDNRKGSFNIHDLINSNYDIFDITNNSSKSE